MLYVGLHFHGYQPPTQPDETIETIFKESYDPVISLLGKTNEVFLSLDIAKSLGERLPHWFILKIAQLVYDGKIELVNTAAYHYLLPLVPSRIALRQLNLNLEFYDKFLPDYKNGVFLPEMAFSPELIPIVKASGSSWLIADDDAFAKTNCDKSPERCVPQNWIPTISQCGIFLRSRFWSNRISRAQYDRGNNFAQELIEAQYQWRKACDISGESYIIFSINLETIGHHHKNAVEEFLTPFYKEIRHQNNQCSIAPLDFIFSRFEKRPISRYSLPPNSWSTEDLSIPFPLWDHPNNPLHNLWNEFVKKTFEIAPEKPDLELQTLLDKAFYSCSPWHYSHGNLDIAAWCLPYFEKIAGFLAFDKKSFELQKIYEKMKDLTSEKI